MRILISIDNFNAHYFIRQGIGRAWATIGTPTLWEINKHNAFDTFDRYQPDIFIGQSYNLRSDLIKVLKENPQIRKVIRVPDMGPYADEVKRHFPVLTASEEEMELTASISPDIVYCHYLWEDLEKTHSKWIEQGFPLMSLLSAADIFDYYNGKEREELKCDIGYIGGRWPYKQNTLDKYLLPLCKNYKVKIFGNSNWGIPQYCGFMKEGMADLFKSAKICPNIHEKHSQVYGYDIVERPFKILSSGGFCISDKVSGLTKVLPQGIIYADSPESFAEKVSYYIDKEDKRNEITQLGTKAVLENHTYFHRVRDILERLGYTDAADSLMNKYEETIKNA